MTKKDDGGPAFPVPLIETRDGAFESAEQTGMSVRDYFAAKAMVAEILTTCSDATPEGAEALIRAAADAGQTPIERIALNAYQMADAMLKARDR